jgi:hypothetical protein
VVYLLLLLLRVVYFESGVLLGFIARGSACRVAAAVLGLLRASLRVAVVPEEYRSRDAWEVPCMRLREVAAEVPEAVMAEVRLAEFTLLGLDPLLPAAVAPLALLPRVRPYVPEALLGSVVVR